MRKTGARMMLSTAATGTETIARCPAPESMMRRMPEMMAINWT